MAAAVKLYVQETFADIDDEFCDAESVTDLEEVVEERTIQVDVNNQIYHDYNETVEVDEVEYEFVQDDAFKVIVQKPSKRKLQNDDDFSWPQEGGIVFATEEELKELQASAKRKSKILIESTSNVYECEDCDYKATRRSNLIRHIKSTHNLDRIECEYCGNNFVDPCSLKRHIKTAHESVIYKCSHCEFKSTRADTLKEHTNVVHFNVRFSCEECDHQATSKRALRRHVKAKHLSTLKNVDPVTVSDHDQLKNMRIGQAVSIDKVDPPDQHSDDQELVIIETTSPVPESSNGGFQVTLEGQNFTFSSVESSDVEETLHFQCSKCDYTNKRKNKLTEHFQSAHQGRKFACAAKDCTFSSASKYNLKRHVESIHEGITYSCPYEGCGYKISQAPHLKAHIKAKHKNQKFKCDLCEFECLTPHGLTQHKKAEHLGIRFKCNLCTYQATQMCNLRTHVRKIHTEKKEKTELIEEVVVGETIVPDF